MSGWTRWAPAAAVTVGAAAATAHGLYEVAVASRVPGVLALSYPVITDGLALVAYSATRRLTGTPAGYAWSVVVLAAGLSGLAQAVYLAADTVTADAALRFGVGAWPAVAAGLAAHLLHLLVTAERDEDAGTGHDADLVEPDPVPVAAEPAPADPPAAIPPAAAPAPERAVDTSPASSPPSGDSDADPRVVALARRLARGEDLTGPAVATEHGLSDRTGRRLLGDARTHLEQHPRPHLVTTQEDSA